MPTITMPRQEWWRQQYRADRYLHVLPAGDLRRRTDDVFENNLTVTDELKIGIRVPSKDGDYWIVAWTHVLEEWAHRVDDHFYGINKASVPQIHWPGLESAVPAFKESRQRAKNVIVKYGKTKHLRPFLETGEILIRPGSGFDDPSFNRAIRDDELSLDIYARSHVLEEAYARYGNTLMPSGPRYGRSIRRLRAPTDYFVHCVSTARDYRLFGAFGADAALIIYRPELLFHRLGTGVSEKLGKWRWFAAPIEYIDPLRPPSDTLDIVRCKHFRFTYQAEYRIVWLPPDPMFQLREFYATVGSMADVAELVELSPAG